MTTIAPTRIDWTRAGAQHINSDMRPDILREVERFDWRDLAPDGLDAPMMQGEGIKSAIRELRLPKVDRVAWNGCIGPYGLYGIRAHYKNATVEVVIIDTGTHLTPVCMFVYEK